MQYKELSATEAGDRLETDVLSLFRKNSQDCYAFKLVDTSGSSREGKVNYVLPQPSDFMVTNHHGETLYIEVKASCVHECLSSAIQNVRPVQAAAARRVTKLGGKYYFLFIDRKNHKIKLYIGIEVSK